jgi:hypothetical protein
MQNSGESRRENASARYGMIRKSVQRFSEKIMPNQRAEVR